MPDINWGTIQPQAGAGPEIASITGLLSALAERRMKAQQEAAARDLQERQFAAQQANTAADNRRADEQLQMQREEYGSRGEERKAAETQKRQEEAYKALPGVQEALQGGQEQVARMRAEPLGMTIGRAEPAQQGPDDTLPMQSTLPYQIGMPAGKVLDYDPRSFEQAQKDKRAKDVAAVNEALAPLAKKLPFGAQAATMAGGLAAIPGTDPADTGKNFMSYEQRREEEAARERNAALIASRQERAATARDDKAIKGEEHKQTLENQRTIGKLQTDTTAWAKENNIPKLGEMYSDAEKAEHMAKSQIGISQIGALDKFVTSVRTGSATGSSVNMAAEHLAGVVGALQGRLARSKTGGLGAEEQGHLQGAIGELKDALKADVYRKHQSFVDSYYTPEYGDAKANIDNAYDKIFGQFGMKAKRHAGTNGITIGGKKFSGGADASTALHDEADSLLGAP